MTIPTDNKGEAETLESGIEEEVVQALDGGDLDRARDLVEQLHYSDVADLLEQ